MQNGSGAKRERGRGSGEPGLSLSLLRHRFERRIQRLRLWSRKSRQEMLFANREDAAKLLAQRLSAYCEKDNPLVLAIPRGAVPMARMIAAALAGSLDVVLVRKLGHPEQPELAIGAIDERGNTFFSAWAAEVSPAYIESEKQRQLAVLQTRRAQYTPMHEAIDPCGRLVVVRSEERS